ncbi:hypothetical protein BMS3Abin04_02473 [bacterium BMS3Abin04]|nr:hypothetical protein BMS3Abin04_02473 [bacterium BMS3Abin04]
MINTDSYEKLKQWIPSVLLLPIAFLLVINHGKFIFILDHLNLLFHEGGHGIFRIFGKFIYTAGGSLMQIIIPSLFIYYFLSNKKRIGAQISLFYLAENLMNIGVYAADARARKLPLLGGNKVYHDWHYLLNKLGILDYCQAVGFLFFYSAIAVLIIGIIIPLVIKNYKESDIEMNL